MEGFLQSLKFDDPLIQVEVCGLAGIDAKRRGNERTEEWKKVQKLWWQGLEFNRHGRLYQELLDRAFNALARNQEFRKALSATGNEALTHSIGNSDPHQTILTEAEFCSRLMKIRASYNS
jgi:hypothetical protein